MESEISQAKAREGLFGLLGVVVLLWFIGGWWTVSWLLCVVLARLLFAGEWGRPWRGAIPGVPVAPQKGAMRHLLSGIGVLALTYAVAVVAAFIALGGGDALDRTTGWYVVGGVQPKSAAEGLLLPGDRILRYDGNDIYAIEHSETGKSLTSLVQGSQGRSVAMTVSRAGRELSVELAARLDSELSSSKGEDSYRLGIALDIGFDKGGLATTLAYCAARPAATFGDFARIWWGWGHEVDELSGPVGISTEAEHSPTSPQAEGVMLLFVIGGVLFFAVDFIVGLLYWGHRRWLRTGTAEALV